jgi:two-component system, OmpR family, response regulator NblR
MRFPTSREVVMDRDRSISNSKIFLLGTNLGWSEKIGVELKKLGYQAIIENDLDRAWQRLKSLLEHLAEDEGERVMLVIDRASTAEAGIEFCRQLRHLGYRLPILMLLPEGTVEERVVCLDAGADDHLIEPFHPEEFLQRVRLYLNVTEANDEQIRFGDLVLDLNTHQILRKNRSIELTMKEFELLKYLMSNPQKVLSREDIIENVWGYDYRGESNVIEVYIRYLRLKLETEGQKRLIQTIRGIGYVLRDS